MADKFGWIKFYEAFADRLLEYREKRDKLLDGIYNIIEKTDCLNNMNANFQAENREG